MLRGRPYGGGFNFANIVGDPFALATVSIAIVRAPSIVPVHVRQAKKK